MFQRARLQGSSANVDRCHNGAAVNDDYGLSSGGDVPIDRASASRRVHSDDAEAAGFDAEQDTQGGQSCAKVTEARGPENLLEG
jgi:hypothetical protein